MTALGKYLQFILDMETLMDQDKYESEEADALREKIEKVWFDLTDEEKDQLRALSIRLDDMRTKGKTS